MPYSHSTSLVLRARSSSRGHRLVAHTPRSPRHASAQIPPVARLAATGQCRVLSGARTATLGHSRPFQAVLWGVPGQLAAGRPRFTARVGVS